MLNGEQVPTMPRADLLSTDAALSTRRSVRAFLPKPVARPMIEELLALSSRSASGSNIQPWKVHVVSGDACARKSACHRTRAACSVRDLRWFLTPRATVRYAAIPDEYVKIRSRNAKDDRDPSSHTSTAYPELRRQHASQHYEVLNHVNQNQ